MMMLSSKEKVILLLCILAFFFFVSWYQNTKWEHKDTVMPFKAYALEAVERGTSAAVTPESTPNLFCEKFPSDIELFNPEQKDSSFCCKTCAIVSSSGMMLNSNAGADIDKHDCVIRMNNAPTKSYERDVGGRTTFRFYSHTSVVDVKNMLVTHGSEVNSTIFIAWGPEKNMLPGRITYNHLKDTARRNPGIKQYILSQKRMSKSDHIFEDETGKNRLKSGAYLSTGFFTILFAKDVCEFMHIYGMVEDDYCKKPMKRLLADTPYHYYQKGAKQCATYTASENTPRGGHRFITEKKIFKKWAKEWKNVKFYNPEWNLLEKES